MCPECKGQGGKFVETKTYSFDPPTEEFWIPCICQIQETEEEKAWYTRKSNET